METIIRTPGNDSIKLCEHIILTSIRTTDESFDECEYVKTLNIVCSIYKAEHEVVMLIN
jgi:hypothetical protein